MNAAAEASGPTRVAHDEPEQTLQRELERLRREHQTLVETVRYTRQQLEQKIEEISLVRLVAENGLRSLIHEHPLSFILEHVCRLTEAEHGSLMLLDHSEGRLYLAASCGPDRIPPYERSYKLGEDIARWIDQSLSATQPPLDPDQVEVLRESDPQHGSILCYPLIAEHSLVGVLSIGHSRPEAFSANTERILYIIANQVALTVYSAHLLSEHRKQRVVLQRSHERYQSLVARVNDLLDLARLESGSPLCNSSPIRLREILSGLRPRFKPQLRRKQLRMKMVMPKRIPRVNGDAERLRQALCILLEDAIRFSPEQGLIRLEVTLESYDPVRWPRVQRRTGGERFLLVSLSDSAPSMPVQLQVSVFNRRSAQDPPMAKSRGPNLSLYLAKEIIESHGGQIWLESVPPQGNTYRFSLPVA